MNQWVFIEIEEGGASLTQVGDPIEYLNTLGYGPTRISTVCALYVNDVDRKVKVTR